MFDVDLAIKDGDFPVRYANVYQRQFFFSLCLKLDHVPPRCAIERFLVVAEGGLLATFKRRFYFPSVAGRISRKSPIFCWAIDYNITT